MIKLAILTCSEIDVNACNDDNLIIPLLKSQEIEAVFQIWDDLTVDWSSFDCILIRSTWDYTEKIEQFKSFINKLPREVKLFNAHEIVMNNFNKSYLFDLEERGFEIVPSLKSKVSQDTIEEAFTKFQSDKIIIKPLIGAGASGIQVIEKDNLNAVVENNNEELIQPFQDSISTDGEVSLIFFNGDFSHAILKVPKKNEFRSQEEFGSKITPLSPDSQTINYSKKVLESITTDSLFARVDLLKNEENEWRYIGEVELIEPALYLSFDKDSAQRFCNAIVKRVKSE
ncbi:RimK family alpha-L-glutamate ligase [Halobacteriovorax sp.]|uniref:ATP-grasp domain-containing protein n=1 Tax=Halobacteriovorax sp. TaxID=2020862 RepID=UPI003567295B